MSSIWIGIEGGGSRSNLKAIDNNYRILLTLEGPPLHAKHYSYQYLSSKIHALYQEASSGLNSSINGLGLALAGAGRKADQDHIKSAVASSFPNLPIHVTSDVKATHIGAFENQNGILVIAGTGSIVYGRRGQNWQRAGGYGYKLGDEGSGHELGIAGLRAVGEHYDGGRTTHLTALLEDDFDIESRDDLIRWTYDADHHPSNIAPVILKAARQKDPVCQDIVERETLKLADLVKTVLDKIDMDDPSIILYGGLFDSNYYHTAFLDALNRTIENFREISPQYDAATGVCILMQNRVKEN